MVQGLSPWKIWHFPRVIVCWRRRISVPVCQAAPEVINWFWREKYYPIISHPQYLNSFVPLKHAFPRNSQHVREWKMFLISEKLPEITVNTLCKRTAIFIPNIFNIHVSINPFEAKNGLFSRWFWHNESEDFLIFWI